MATLTDDNAADEQSGKAMCRLLIIRCTTIFNSVLLPLPDEPIMQKISPCGTLRVTSDKAVFPTPFDQYVLDKLLINMSPLLIPPHLA